MDKGDSSIPRPGRDTRQCIEQTGLCRGQTAYAGNGRCSSNPRLLYVRLYHTYGDIHCHFMLFCVAGVALMALGGTLDLDLACDAAALAWPPSATSMCVCEVWYVKDRGVKLWWSCIYCMWQRCVSFCVWSYFMQNYCIWSFIVSKIIVCDVIVCKILYANCKGEKEAASWAGTGIYNQKQQLYTKMWGIVGLKAGKIKFILNYFLIVKVFCLIWF